MEFSDYNWATISETICCEMLIFGKKAFWTLLYQNILTNPIISEISFLWRHHFSTLFNQTINFYSTNQFTLEHIHVTFVLRDKG